MSTDDCYPEKRERADELLTVLANPIRREIVHYFENHIEAPDASLEELTNHLADRLPAESQDNLMLTLPQTHLSKLQSQGWLSYDTQTGEITYHGNKEAKQLLTEIRDMF